MTTTPSAPPPPPSAAPGEAPARAAGGAGAFWRAALTVARRDFLAVVATPLFLLFLAAPMFMLGFGVLGGEGGRALAAADRERETLVAIVPAAEAALVTAADQRLRLANARAIRLLVVPAPADPARARATEAQAIATLRAEADPAARSDRDVRAVWTGGLAQPLIHERRQGSWGGDWLALVVDTARRDQAAGARSAAAPSASASASAARPMTIADLSGIARVALPGKGTGDAARARQALGYVAVFVLFLLTLLLASQAVGMLAEEKSNKVIEVLAAAVPLEAVFIGKVLGLIGVAVVYIATWALLLTGVGLIFGLIAAPTGLAGAAAGASPELAAAAAGGGTGMAGDVAASLAAGLADMTPALGWPGFLGLGLIYFITSFLLFGGLFLAIGALASSARDIQMLSLPVIIVEMLMFALASAGAADPGGSAARWAAIMPFSSPYAMAARAATDAAWWPHAVALAWQALWVAIVIGLGVRLFRIGVLGNGISWPPRLLRRT